MFRLLRNKEETLTLQTETILIYDKETRNKLYTLRSKYKPKRRPKRAPLEDAYEPIMNANGQTPIPGQKAPRYTGFNEPFNHG